MTEWEKTYHELKRINWITLLILASACYLLADNSTTLGLISGGFLSIANFSFLQSTVRNAFPLEGDIKINKAFVIIKAFSRLLILGIILFILITHGLLDTLGLTIGLSTVVISIISFGINRARKSKIEGAV